MYNCDKIDAPAFGESADVANIGFSVKFVSV